MRGFAVLQVVTVYAALQERDGTTCHLPSTDTVVARLCQYAGDEIARSRCQPKTILSPKAADGTGTGSTWILVH